MASHIQSLLSDGTIAECSTGTACHACHATISRYQGLRGSRQVLQIHHAPVAVTIRTRHERFVVILETLERLSAVRAVVACRVDGRNDRLRGLQSRLLPFPRRHDTHFGTLIPTLIALVALDVRFSQGDSMSHRIGVPITLIFCGMPAAPKLVAEKSPRTRCSMIRTVPPRPRRRSRP